MSDEPDPIREILKHGARLLEFGRATTDALNACTNEMMSVAKMVDEQFDELRGRVARLEQLIGDIAAAVRKARGEAPPDEPPRGSLQ
jgi:hypothetical protein